MKQQLAIFGMRQGVPQLLLARGEQGERLLAAGEQPLGELSLRRDEEFDGEDTVLRWTYVGERTDAAPPDCRWLPWDELPEPLLQQAAVRCALRKVARLEGRQWVCAIVGAKDTSPRYSPAVADDAFRAGRIAAELGLAVLTGGLGGVMARAAEGAVSAAGVTLGILPGDCHTAANPHIRFVLPSGLSFARNYLTAVAADFMIALPGGTGTLEEICFAIDFGRPVLSWGSWELPETTPVPAGDADALQRALAFAMNRKFKQNSRT